MKINYDDNNIDKLENIINLAFNKSVKIKINVYCGIKNGDKKR